MMIRVLQIAAGFWAIVAVALFVTMFISERRYGQDALPFLVLLLAALLWPYSLIRRVLGL
jgi:hypothetical protein